MNPKCHHMYPHKEGGKGRFGTWRRGPCEEGTKRDVKTLALKTGVIWPQAKERRQPQKLEETKYTLLLELPEGAQPSKTVYRHLASRTVRENISVVLSHQEFVVIFCSKHKK